MIPAFCGEAGKPDEVMQRVDGYYLYRVGSQIHPLENLKYQSESGEGTSYSEAYYPILIAEGALEPLLSRSVFQLRTSMQAGQDLLDALPEVKIPLRQHLTRIRS